MSGTLFSMLIEKMFRVNVTDEEDSV